MRSRRLAAAAAAVATSLVLAACGGGSDADADGGASGAGFPVTIEHAFGSTTIESEPERVATIAWANHDVPLALGVVPVGMAKATWGDDDGDGVLPWVEEKLEELDAETPVLFDETDGIDFEAVSDTRPDVILASYSGLTKKEYETLSKIAPVVAFPEQAWATSWEDMVLLNSKAIGLAEEGEELVDELQTSVDEALEKHSALQGKKVMFSYIDPNDYSQVGFYTTQDTRPGFLVSIGLPTPTLVEEASKTSKTFYETISSEKADELADVDVLVTYGDDKTLAKLQADPLIGKIPAVARGSVAVLPDSTPLAAAGNPSPLSIQWNLDDYFALLADAAAQSE